MRGVLVGLGLCVLPGCDRNRAESPPANFEGPAAPAPLAAVTWTVGDYCRIVATPDLAQWDRDVLTTCPGGGTPAPGATCTVAELAGATARPVPAMGVHLALRAAGGRLIVLHADGALALRDASGRETPVAAWAAEPSMSTDGVRVAYVTRDAGASATRLVRHDLRDGTVRVIAEDSTASSPFVVPNSDDVVYVSARSGLAAIWRGNGEYEIQVTNVGVAAGDQGVLPTFGSRAVWIPGTRRLAFEVRTDGPMVWSYDVAAATVEPLGPGAWPQIGADRVVLAAIPVARGASCAIRYPLHPTP
jgi:hypothetical protein